MADDLSRALAAITLAAECIKGYRPALEAHIASCAPDDPRKGVLRAAAGFVDVVAEAQAMNAIMRLE